MLGVPPDPLACHAACAACSAEYEGKKTSMPCGTMRAKLTSELPRSALVSSSSRLWYADESSYPDGPAPKTPTRHWLVWITCGFSSCCTNGSPSSDANDERGES
eukprot:3603621-Prymnesium_polylepis.1